jgi:hypothetical protein
MLDIILLFGKIFRLVDPGNSLCHAVHYFRFFCGVIARIFQRNFQLEKNKIFFILCINSEKAIHLVYSYPGLHCPGSILILHSILPQTRSNPLKATHPQHLHHK